MATVYKIPQPAASAIPSSVKHFGVFLHNDPQDINDADAVLVETAPDFNSAYQQMREHAADEASQRPDWGLTNVKTSPKTYDILGHDGEVRISYEIATICPSGLDVDGDFTWMREPDWRAGEDFDRPPEHFGMYIDLDIQGKKPAKHFLVGGFSTLGEATDAMKRSVHSYLADDAGAHLYERTIDVVGPKGDTRQRYQVVNGRWRYGEFVKEQAWLQKEEQLSKEDAYPSPNSSFEKDAIAQHSILRMPDNSSSPLRQMSVASNPAQAGPTRAPAPTQAGLSRAPSHAPAPAPASSRPRAVIPAVPEDVEMIQDDDGDVAMADNQDPDLTPKADDVELWCNCQQPDDGSFMIGCENDDCPILWYHGRCLGLTQGLAGAWYCAQCAPAPAPKKRGRPKALKSVAKKAAAATGGKEKGKAGGRC
jgi:hypothetical protein